MKILISGGTGFIGRNLIENFLRPTDTSMADKGFGVESTSQADAKEKKSHISQDKHQITIISRQRQMANGYDVRMILGVDELDHREEFDVVINLAGASIAEKKWSEKQKKLISDSRLVETRRLVAWIERVGKKPKVFISASAVGYYGAMGQEIIDERVRAGHEFTSKLCAAWEYEARRAEPHCRTIIMRLGLVLAAGGGFLSRMILPMKFGCSPQMGQGKQYMSWIHIKDLILAVNFFLNDKNCQGVYNLTSPYPIRQKEFAKIFAKVIKKPALFHLPAFMIKLLFGEMGDRLLLHGQRVMPKKLLAQKFSFQFSDIDMALQDIFLS
ncbi:MAG: TIGR01777 family oxidoreductase [Alphaproteobacteria bacterium]